MRAILKLILLLSLSLATPVQAAQQLEVMADQVLIFTDPDLQSVPLETASQSDVYQASDRSYRGFYKVLLKKYEEGTRYGWIPENAVRTAAPEKTAVTAKGDIPFEQTKVSIEGSFIVSSYAPTDLQKALSLPESSINGTGFGLGISLRAGDRGRFYFQGETFGTDVTGTAASSYMFSGALATVHFEYDILRVAEFALSAGLGGGALFGTLAIVSGGEALTSPSLLSGVWDPRASLRWNFYGAWNAHFRFGRVFVAESKQTFQDPAVFVDLSHWYGQLGISYSFW